VSVWFRDDYAEELDQAGHLEAYRAKVWDKDAAKVFTFPAPAEWHPDAWVGRKAVERINAADQDRPQFTWVSISGPHFPFDPPAEYLDRVDPESIKDPVITGDLDDPDRMHYWSRHGAPGRWIESGRNDRYDADYWRRLRANYYANVAREMWMKPVPDGDRTAIRVPPSIGFALAITVVVTLAFGVSNLATRLGDEATFFLATLPGT
jgi:hypothetical protein